MGEERIKKKKLTVHSKDFTLCVQRNYQNGKYLAWFEGVGTISQGETPTAAQEAAVTNLKMHWFDYTRQGRKVK